MFILPAATIRRVESILASFLWKGISLSPAGAKVAWASLCYPTCEGGLGVKRLRDWNRAAILKHIWHILTDRSSVWSSWVHQTLLRGRSFWHIRITSSASWSWRKILQSRLWCKGLFLTCIGNGKDTSLWQDYWLPQGRLCDLYTFRTLSTTGLPWDAKVSDIIQGASWRFPTGCPALQHVWDSIDFQPRAGASDHTVWTGHSSGSFSIATAWDLLRSRRASDSLHHLLWFSGHIPRHSFILWLAALGRLRTMDRLHSPGASPECTLCHSEIESHDHLFFRCRFSTLVWDLVSAKTLTPWPSLSWPSLVCWASLHLHRKGDFQHILSRLVLSATVYYLWYERNNRIFHARRRPASDISADICDIVRAKILDLAPRCIIPPQLRALWSIPP